MLTMWLHKSETRKVTLLALGVALAALATTALWLLLLSPWSSGEKAALAVVGDPAIKRIEQLSNLPVPTFRLAIDGSGRIWLPQLAIGGLKNDGTQINELWRFDPGTGELVRLPLPGHGGANSLARITTRGSSVYVGWDTHLYRVDAATGKVEEKLVLPFDSAFLPKDGRPPVTLLSDLKFGPDGSLWIARERYSALTQLHLAGTWSTFPLPPGYGEPSSLTVDDQGHVWASVIGHAPAAAAPGLQAVNAFAITVEFNPASGLFTRHPIPSGDLAALRGDRVLAVGGGPGGLRSVEKTGASTALSNQAGTSPNDHVLVAPDGTIWYTSIGTAKIVRRAPDGTEQGFTLPSSTTSAEYTLCVPIPNSKCPDVVRSVTYVGDIALDLDGHLWFTSANGPYVAEIVP